MQSNRSNPPPRQPGDPPPCTVDPHLPETRRRAQWQRPEAEVEGGQDSCLAPGPNQQRHPRRTPPAAAPRGLPPQWTDPGGHDGLRAPRTNKAGKSHQPAVSPSRTRSEAGPKRSPPYPGIHHRVHNLTPADSSSGHAAPDSHHSGQIQAITTVAVPCGQRGGQIAPTGRQSQPDAERGWPKKVNK